MGNYYLISAKLNQGIVIDFRMQTEPNTRLQVFTVNRPATDNQLWEFVPDPGASGYSFIKSKLGDYVIGIKGASATPRTELQLLPQSPTGQADHQLWNFTPGPGSSFNPKITLLFGPSPDIIVSGNGFVPLNRISLWYAFADPVSGTNSATGQDPVFAPSTVLGEFRYAIPTHEPDVNSGATVEITAADGMNRVTVHATFDRELKSWNVA